MRPRPAGVDRWTVAVPVLRGLDALAAWLAIWGAAAMALPSGSGGPLAVLAVVAVGLVALVRPLRASWRPVSGTVALVVSRRLSPGDHAWYVRRGGAERVLVTARRRTRVVIVRLADEASEGLQVRRTRVLLVPDDSS